MVIFRYLSWFPLCILDILATLSAYPLAPVAALFAKDAQLPKLFWYLGTHDNTLEGDSGHIERWSAFALKYGAFGRYCQYVAWLWRNKAYNFAYYVTGRVVELPVKYYGNPETESSDVLAVVPGWVLYTSANAWGFFAYIPWLKLGTMQFSVRIYLGWKMKGMEHSSEAERCMLADHINPFRYHRVEK